MHMTQSSTIITRLKKKVVFLLTRPSLDFNSDPKNFIDPTPPPSQKKFKLFHVFEKVLITSLYLQLMQKPYGCRK